MGRSTTSSYWREKGNRQASPSVGLRFLQATIDPTDASVGTGVVLPAGAIPLFVQTINGGATGGTNPTVDVGTLADPDGFANELDADAMTGMINTGALLGAPLTVNTEIHAGVGASAATGGSVTFGVYFVMNDDQKDGRATP